MRTFFVQLYRDEYSPLRRLSGPAIFSLLRLSRDNHGIFWYEGETKEGLQIRAFALFSPNIHAEQSRKGSHAIMPIGQI